MDDNTTLFLSNVVAVLDEWWRDLYGASLRHPVGNVAYDQSLIETLYDLSDTALHIQAGDKVAAEFSLSEAEERIAHTEHALNVFQEAMDSHRGTV